MTYHKEDLPTKGISDERKGRKKGMAEYQTTKGIAVSKVVNNVEYFNGKNAAKYMEYTEAGFYKFREARVGTKYELKSKQFVGRKEILFAKTDLDALKNAEVE